MQQQESIQQIANMLIFALSAFSTYGVICLIQRLYIPFILLKEDDQIKIIQTLEFYKIPVNKKIAQHLYENNIKKQNIPSAHLLYSKFGKLIKPCILSYTSSNTEFTDLEKKTLLTLNFKYDEKENKYYALNSDGQKLEIRIKIENEVRLYDIRIGSLKFTESELEKIMFG